MPATPPPPASNPDPIESALHDLTNALSAARSFADVLALRAASPTPKDLPQLVDALLRELDRANDLVRNVRRETYHKGDVLRCTKCNYTFVYRKKLGKGTTCRRCSSTEIVRWKPTA